MSDEYKKALLQVAGKLTEEQEKMCGGRERGVGECVSGIFLVKAPVLPEARNKL